MLVYSYLFSETKADGDLFNNIFRSQSSLDSKSLSRYTARIPIMARRRSYNRSAPLYHRITIIPGILYLNISRSGLSLSFGKSSVGRATINSSGVRLNKSICGFRIGKSFSFSKLAGLFGGRGKRRGGEE